MSVVLTGHVQKVFWRSPEGDRVGVKFVQPQVPGMLTVFGILPVLADYFHYKLRCDRKRDPDRGGDSYVVRTILEWRRLPLTIDMLRRMLRAESGLTEMRVVRMISGYPSGARGDTLQHWVQEQPWWEEVRDCVDYFRHEFITVLFRYYTEDIVQSMDYHMAEAVLAHLRVAPIDLCFKRRVRDLFGADTRVPELPVDGFLLACADHGLSIEQRQQDALALYHKEILARMQDGHTAVRIEPAAWKQPRTRTALEYISIELGVVHVYDDRQFMCLQDVRDNELVIGKGMHDLFENHREFTGTVPPAPQADGQQSKEVLNAEQQQVVDAACTRPLVCVTGGPGTGKTSTAREIVHRLGEHKFLCVSFTGKASCNLVERVAKQSITIHRALGLIAYQRKLEAQGEGPLHPPDDDTVGTPHIPLTWDDADSEAEEQRPAKKARKSAPTKGPLLTERPYLLIDEMSNVELSLFARLLREMDQLRLLVLIGDVNQIESIGPGAVFMDYLQRYQGTPSVVRLNRVYRVDDNSAVLNECARHVLAREPRRILDKSHRDVEDGHPMTVMPRTASVRADVLRVLDKYPDQRRFQFIVYRNDKRKEINTVVFEFLFGGARVGKGKRVGEKIVFMENNYGGVVSKKKYKSAAVSNGEFAFIKRIYDLNVRTGHRTDVASTGARRTRRKGILRFMVLEGDKVLCLDLPKRYHYDTGYACTVHKMQGSESEDVCLYIEPNPKEHFNWKLLYTAMTRSRNTLTVVCCRDQWKVSDYLQTNRLTDIEQIVLYHQPVDRVTTLQTHLPALPAPSASATPGSPSPVLVFPSPTLISPSPALISPSPALVSPSPPPPASPMQERPVRARDFLDTSDEESGGDDEGFSDGFVVSDGHMSSDEGVE